MKLLMCLAVLVVLTAGCDNGSSSSTTTSPTTTTVAAASITEVFTGSLAVGSANFHLFTVGQAPGTVNATLTAAGPPATIQVGFALGTPSGGACTPLVTLNTAASTTPQLTGTATATGQYCVQVTDIGNLAAPVTYSITVAHP